MIKTVAKLYKDAFSGIPFPIWILCVAGLINRAGTMVLPFLSLYLTTERGFDLQQASWVLLAFGAGSVVGSYFGGQLCNRFAFQKILVSSLILSGVGFVTLGFLRSFSSILFGFFVLSAISDSFRPAMMTAVGKLSGGQTARSMTLLRLAVNLGMAIGPAVGGLLAQRNFLAVFWTDGLTCVMSGGFLFMARQFLVPPETEATGADIRAQSPADRRNNKRWFPESSFLLFLLFNFVMAFGFFQLFGCFPLYLKSEFLLSEEKIGLLLAINPFVIALFEMVLIHKVQHRDHFNLFALGGALIGIGLGLLPVCLLWAPHQPGQIISLVVLLLIWTLGEMLALPIANALVTRYAKPERMGSYMGWYSGTYALALLIAPPLGLFIMRQLGGDAVWWFVLGTSLLIPLGIHHLKPHLNSQKETENG